uniref:Receptor ligand binding region domain-containing protein n=1 Tax=Laticauda laticaudata TaxID=8630 RepID=A0A8C5RLM2_LATLA
MNRMPLLLLHFWLLPPTTAKRMQTVCVMKNPFRIPKAYYKPGDLIIGGNLLLKTIISSNFPDFKNDPSLPPISLFLIPMKYQQFQALMFAVREINKDLLLPNITLGFHIYDNHQIEREISLISLSLLSTRGQTIPGYQCDRQDPLLSVIGGLNSKSSRQMASIFSIFKVPQLGVGFEFSPRERRVYPSFFRINPKESPQYVGLIQLLLHFQWNWIGLVVSEDDSGERFVSSLMPMLKEKEICLAFTKMLKSEVLTNTMLRFLWLLKSSFKVEVIVLFVDYRTIATLQGALYSYEQWIKTSYGKVWIITSHCELSGMGTLDTLEYMKPFHGALHFRDHTGNVPEFSHFLLSLDPLNSEGDIFLLQWWERVFDCKFYKHDNISKGEDRTCTGKENLQNLPAFMFETSMTGDSYNVYNAIYALAHALCAMYEAGARPTMMRAGKRISNVQSWELLPYLRNVQFNNSAGDKISLSENGLGSAHYDLFNWIFFPNQSFVPMKVGQIDHRTPPGQDFTINSGAIIWTKKKMPFARCGMKRCQAGERRRVPEGQQVCCYRCALCPEGTISNQTEITPGFEET